MGYWGHLIATRKRQDQLPVTALAAFGEHQQPVADNHHGWLVIQIYGNEPDLPLAINALATQTGSPAIAAYVLDSDCAIVEAATPKGARWSAVLNPERAAEYGAPSTTPDAATVAGATWARAAQLWLDDDLLRHILGREEIFAEDQFLALLSAIPAAGGDADST